MGRISHVGGLLAYDGKYLFTRKTVLYKTCPIGKEIVKVRTNIDEYIQKIS